MPSYTDSDIPGAFLPYWRQALDRSPDEAKELMAQFISDLSDILLRTEGAKEGGQSSDDMAVVAQATVEKPRR